MITPEGDYLSNLSAPDLRRYFKHLHWRKMGHSMGHLVASDWADKADDDPVFGLYKKCGLWTRDEAAILWNCAHMTPSKWLDIGCHTGWTSAYIAAGCGGIADWWRVECVDPLFYPCMVRDGDASPFMERFALNARACQMSDWWSANGYTSAEFFNQAKEGLVWNGICIDGDHEPGKPLEDAQNAVKHLSETGVILLHDGIGAPVREAVTWLMNNGFKARCYWTPHIVFCCWRGDFSPVDHVGDPRINWVPHIQQMKKDFDFGRLS